MTDERQVDHMALFWRAFFDNAGPAFEIGEEQLASLSDEEVVRAGENLVEGLAPAIEAVGRLVGLGVRAYRQASC